MPKWLKLICCNKLKPQFACADVCVYTLALTKLVEGVNIYNAKTNLYAFKESEYI